MRMTVFQKHLIFVDPVYQALALWLVFFVLSLLINDTIPFALECRGWWTC